MSSFQRTVWRAGGHYFGCMCSYFGSCGLEYPEERLILNNMYYMYFI